MDCKLRNNHSFSSLDHKLVHTGQDAEHLGLGDARREHNAKCIVPSKTMPAHATAMVDDERGAVLLVHNGHDDNRREHSAAVDDERGPKRNAKRNEGASSSSSSSSSCAGVGHLSYPLPPYSSSLSMLNQQELNTEYIRESSPRKIHNRVLHGRTPNK